MFLRILVSTGKPALQGRLRRLLESGDVAVDAVKGSDRLWELARRESYDLVVVSRALLPDEPGDLIATVRALPETPEVVVVTGREDEEDRAKLLAAGCLSVLPTTLSNEMLGDTLKGVLARLKDAAGGATGASKITPRLANFVSHSPSMQTFMKIARRCAGSDTSLLITGETGVGKEWLATAIHAESPRGSGPMVAVNCGAISETLLESELFGHEEGAFTGATRSRRGMFELAHGGTIFLDEIGEMPLHLQVKLLRVLQSREVQRVGAERPIRVDVRVMAATNRDLEVAVQAGTFRGDLYFRLGVVTLAIPPLRDRTEDIPELVENYLEYYGNLMHSEVTDISTEALKMLVQYDWPGNVRELMNVIERAMLLCEGDQIGLIDLPESIGGIAMRGVEVGSPEENEQLVPPAFGEMTYREARDLVLSRFERAYFATLLESTDGRVGDAAALAGIDPRSMYNKMKRLGLRKEDYRQARRGEESES